MTAEVSEMPPGLSRADIRERLTVGRPARTDRGDAVTAARLMREGNLQTLDVARFTPGTTSGIPYDAPAARVPAAVLVPLVEHAGGFSVLFTQRNAALKAHAGQISFPGGRVEADDADAVAAALRESREEIGLVAESVEVLGRLDPYVTVTGFEITPIVGAVRPPLDLVPDPVEVDDIFEVPLAFFLDPANHQRHSRVTGGITRAYYAMPYGERYIWGATAGMLLNLYEVLAAR